MTRLDALAEAAAAGFPPVRHAQRVIRGMAAWRAFLRQAQVSEVNAVMRQLRRLRQGQVPVARRRILANPCVVITRGHDVISEEDADRFRRLRLAQAAARQPQQPRPAGPTEPHEYASASLSLADALYEAQMDDMVRLGTPTPDLSACAVVHPPAECVGLVARCLERARQLGLTLPKRFAIHYVYEPRLPRGQAIRRQDGTTALVLNLGEISGASALAQVVFHEAAHLHSYERGDCSDLVKFEREARAFARRALETWHA